MNEQQLAFEVPPSLSSEAVYINSRCLLRKEGDQCVIIVAGLPVYRYSNGDDVAEAYVMVSLVESGFAKQKEVARALRCSVRTLRRNQKRYDEGGMAALATRSGWRQGRRRIPASRLRLIQRLAEQGLSNCEIARRLGVTENAIRVQVGPKKECIQGVLPFPSTDRATTVSTSKQPMERVCELSEDSVPIGSETSTQYSADSHSTTQSSHDKSLIAEADEPVSMCLDVDPSNRTFDRFLACSGLIDDATPLFGESTAVPGAGVLFALPLVVHSGIFRVVRKVYGTIGPAFYGLRTTMLTLVLMALSRIKRPEWLKERDPTVLGRILGLVIAGQSGQLAP